MSSSGSRQPLYETITIIGPGLIGGSIGMAVRRSALAKRVLGVGRRQSSLDLALRAGAVDEVTLDLRAGVAAGDLVIIATPIHTLEKIAADVGATLREGAVLTEVSSVKRAVIDAIEPVLGEGAAFVPTHPMAGSEQRGPEAARADLFQGAVCIFTPVASSPRAEVERLQVFWERIGARIRTLTPERHDQIVAAISHMPHLLCSGLVETIDDEALEYAGTGLIDVTRIASSDPDLWVDICRSNRPAVARALHEMIQTVEALLRTLDNEDYELLRALLERSKTRRDQLLALRTVYRNTE